MRTTYGIMPLTLYRVPVLQTAPINLTIALYSHKHSGLLREYGHRAARERKPDNNYLA